MSTPVSLKSIKKRHSMGEIGRGGAALRLGCLAQITAGPGSTLNQMSEQQIDRMIKYNSVCREHAAEIRAAHADSATGMRYSPEFSRKLVFLSKE